MEKMSRRRLLSWGARGLGATSLVISLTPRQARAYGSWSASGPGYRGAEPEDGLVALSRDWTEREERELRLLRQTWSVPGGYEWRRRKQLETKRLKVASRYYVRFGE